MVTLTHIVLRDGAWLEIHDLSSAEEFPGLAECPDWIGFVFYRGLPPICYFGDSLDDLMAQIEAER